MYHFQWERSVASVRSCCIFWSVSLYNTVWLDFLHLSHTWRRTPTSFSPRLVAVGPGPHDPLSGLLLHLLPGVPGSADHPVQGRTLLLHWPLPGLRRSEEHFHSQLKFWKRNRFSGNTTAGIFRFYSWWNVMLHIEYGCFVYNLVFPLCTILQKWLIVHLINTRHAKYCNKNVKKK